MTKDNPGMDVIILKRLPRFDPQSQDPTAIKGKLSIFANNVYDHLFFKHGCPKNIKIASLKLGLNSQYLQNIVMGNENRSHDGIHLRGTEAPRHFTYRAVEMIKPVIMKTPVNGAESKIRRVRQSAGHTDCPQARYKNQLRRNHGGDRMSSTKDKHQSSRQFYNVPTQNAFDVLGN